MKRTALQPFQLLFAALLLIAAAALPGCRKSPEEVIALLDETEAAELIEASVAERSAGTTTPTIDLTQILESAVNQCGVPGDTSFQVSKNFGTATYNRTFELDWLLTCTQLGIPESATATVGGAGSFTVPHWTGTTTANGNLAFTGLNPQTTDCTVNGSYTYTGSVTGNLRRTDPTLSVVATVTLTNLTINKTTYQVTGGTGTATVTVTNTAGDSATFDGSLVFNGNGSVTVDVNGHSHTFQLQ